MISELVGVRLLLVGGASGVVVLSDLVLVVGLLLKSGVMIPNSCTRFRALSKLLSWLDICGTWFSGETS